MEIQERTHRNPDDFFHIDAVAGLALSAAVLLIAVATLLFSGSAIVYAGRDVHPIEIRILSSHPDMVSGGMALVQITLPSHMTSVDIRLILNGKAIDGDLHSQQDGTILALIHGLALGENHLAVETKESRWRSAAEFQIINHAITGPIFSGPHQSPYICETATFVLPVTGDVLGQSLDSDCSIATRVDYVYKSEDGTFKPLPDSSSRPPDVSHTTTSDGRTVSYIVRVETGTINRAIYQIAMLDDPENVLTPNPWTPLPGWNGRLIYIFGGGCRREHQGSSFVTAGPLNDLWLSKGYAAATSSLNVFDNNCNDVVSAETMMMVKEHFINQYGVPRYTIGWGPSGGSMQQHLISLNYPGLLEGIAPSLSFPDAITFFIPIADCPLLTSAFDKSTNIWTNEQKTAVAGWGTWDYCTEHRTSDWSALMRAGPNPGIEVTGCRVVIPVQLIYDPIKNPTGARCTWFDNSVNVFGADPVNKFARRLLDNVGVQYGLNAFNTGQISAEQFIELNEGIGGYDVDGNKVDGRMVGNSEALRIAYASGRLNEGSELGSIPIIDYRPYRDMVADVHDSIRSRTMRARLIAANGNAANQVIIVSPPNTTPSGAAIFDSLASDVLRLMNLWLDNINRDHSPYKTLNEKVVRNKPTELVDACLSASGEKIVDVSKCGDLYPAHGNPRLAAGQPLQSDILKCQLKDVNRHDYALPLTDDQIRRLKAIFPTGVCDYSRPGVGQVRVESTWLAYPSSGKIDLTRESMQFQESKKDGRSGY